MADANIQSDGQRNLLRAEANCRGSILDHLLHILCFALHLEGCMAPTGVHPSTGGLPGQSPAHLSIGTFPVPGQVRGEGTNAAFRLLTDNL